MNLKKLLMDLGNRLVMEFHHNPIGPDSRSGIRSTTPIKDFIDYVNSNADARFVLAEMGVEFPIVQPSMKAVNNVCDQLLDMCFDLLVNRGVTQGVHRKNDGDLSILVGGSYYTLEVTETEVDPECEYGIHLTDAAIGNNVDVSVELADACDIVHFCMMSLARCSIGQRITKFTHDGDRKSSEAIFLLDGKWIMLKVS